MPSHSTSSNTWSNIDAKSFLRVITPHHLSTLVKPVPISLNLEVALAMDIHELCALVESCQQEMVLLRVEETWMIVLDTAELRRPTLVPKDHYLVNCFVIINLIKLHPGHGHLEVSHVINELRKPNVDIHEWGISFVLTECQMFIVYTEIPVIALFKLNLPEHLTFSPNVLGVNSTDVYVVAKIQSQFYQAIGGVYQNPGTLGCLLAY
ncbi:hypothetical protein Tco_1110835 [Tanacetum coccineum]|uniref:Uncharacterized protein n=1 Tax=Tanacetum coccineum TaxID=301880 RepID=A0ABQ5IMA2_9ASTR